jgi:ParB-like chromosome segregation protein Spo0J
MSEELKKIKKEYKEKVSIDSLIEWDKNPRMNDQAVDRLAKIIEHDGFTNPILARMEDNRIIAGHTRIKAARQINLKTVPVLFLDVTEEQANAIAISDNKTSEWASWDDGLLGDLLAELDESGYNLEYTGFSEQEIDQLMGNWVDTFYDEENEINPPDENDDLTEDMEDSECVISIGVSIEDVKDIYEKITDFLDAQDIEYTMKMS